MNLSAIQLEITNKCNFSCKHCYLGKSESSSMLPYKTILSLLTDAKFMGVKNLLITGGEPLLHPDIKNILHTLKILDFKSDIYTNASLVTDDIITLFLDSNTNMRKWM